MSFLNPLLLLGALGIALPIVAHLLNRFEVRQTDWAAMQFLNRNVRVRSRNIKLGIYSYFFFVALHCFCL